MGLTLVAILTAALLLPGIIAARAFYVAGYTREVEVPLPPLSTPDGIALVGAFSIGIHAVYLAGLQLAAVLPPLVPLPPADPYLLFAPPPGASARDLAWALTSGLILLCAIAQGVGAVAGRTARRWRGPRAIYGPLADVIASAGGGDTVFTAYVVTRIEQDSRLVGYQGTVDSLFRDADRFPSKLVLRDAVTFWLEMGEDGPRRRETGQRIDWIVLTADGWHNVAFRVFRLVDDPETSVGLD
jgi:hypothetical protein